MKYIKLYEAFESNIISNMKKFISKKIGKENSNNFLIDIKNIFNNNFDFPISKLKDDDIIYTSTNKAIYIKPPKNWKPSKKGQPYFLKFWFSLEKGYLGFTGVGKEEIIFHDSNNKNVLNNEDFKQLKKIGIEKGELTPVYDYDYLETGDKVIGLFHYDHNDYRYLTLATIYKDEYSIYAIQNVSNGGNPTRNDWMQYGDLSWNIYSNHQIGSDHFKLNLYKESDNPIEYYKYNNNSNEYLNFNLPIYRDELTSWEGSDPSVIKDSEFCMIINIDNIINSDYEKLDSIKDFRKSNRESATALYTNEYILGINIERYAAKILNSMNIDENTIKDDFKNLNKIVKIIFINKYPIYNLYRLELLDRFILELINIVKYNYRFNRILDLVERYKRQLNDIYVQNTECEKLILNSDNEDLNKIYQIYKSLNEYITNYINGLDIKTIKELKELSFKFQHVNRLMSDSYIGELESNKYLSYMNNIEAIKNRLSLDSKNYTDDIEKLNFLEKSIKSIFK